MMTKEEAKTKCSAQGKAWEDMQRNWKKYKFMSEETTFTTIMNMSLRVSAARVEEITRNLSKLATKSDEIDTMKEQLSSLMLEFGMTTFNLTKATFAPGQE